MAPSISKIKKKCLNISQYYGTYKLCPFLNQLLFLTGCFFCPGKDGVNMISDSLLGATTEAFPTRIREEEPVYAGIVSF